jgi:hypothetical protein
MAKRAGRKRKLGVARFACGKVKLEARERQPNPTLVAKAYRIARGATAENWTAQHHATPFGVLYRDGWLSKEPGEAKALYDAGLWFGGLWRNMRSAIEAKPPHARAPGGATAAKGLPREESDLLRMIARHRAAERVLTRLEVMAVWEIIMVEREVTPAWLVSHLLSGLPKLVKAREG